MCSSIITCTVSSGIVHTVIPDIPVFGKIYTGILALPCLPVTQDTIVTMHTGIRFCYTIGNTSYMRWAIKQIMITHVRRNNGIDTNITVKEFTNITGVIFCFTVEYTIQYTHKLDRNSYF